MSVLRKALSLPRKLSRSESGDDPEDIEELKNAECVHSGWLTKKLKLKKKYYWCSLSGRWLSFWEDKSQQESSKLARSSNYIDMTSAQQVMLSTQSHMPYGFDIITPKEKTTLIAKNKQETDEWIQCLQLAMEHKTRRQSLRLSSANSLDVEGKTPTIDEESEPLYEDPFDGPTTIEVSSNVDCGPGGKAGSQRVGEVASSNVYSEISLPPTDEVETNLYEEVSHPPQPETKLVTGAKSSKSKNCETADSVDSLYGEIEDTPPPISTSQSGNQVQKVAPPVARRRPTTKRITESVVQMPLLAEEEMSDDRPRTMIVEDQDGSRVVVPMRGSRLSRSSVATTPDEEALPSTTDIYAQVIKRRTHIEPSPTNDRVSKVMMDLEAPENKPKLNSVEYEKEPESIKQLRALLNIPAQPSKPLVGTPDKGRTFEKMTRGQHMQALHDLLYTL